MPLLVKALLGLLALVVVGAGAATAYVLVVLNNPSEATAQYIPASATAYFSVNLRPGLRQTMNAGDFFSRIDSDELEDWREERLEEIEDETGIHPTEDVADWLGTDISAAILNDDIDDLEWVVMFQVSDREGAEDFAEDLVDYITEDSWTEFEEDSSDGLDLWIAEDDSVAIAVSDAYLLIGDGEDTVEDIAENVEESLRRSLLDNDAFVAAQEAAPSPRMAFGYLDIEALWPEQTDLLDLGVTSEQLRDELEGNWPVYVSMSASFQSNGMRMDFSYFLEEESIEWDGSPVLAQQVLPADSLVAMSTTGVLEAWEDWWEIIEETDPYAADDLHQLLLDFEEEAGIDVEDDVLDTLSGEMAAALLPSDFDFSSEDAALASPVHALFLAGLDDPETLEDTLDDLLAALEENFDYDPEKVDIGEFEAVTVPLGETDESSSEFTPGITGMDEATSQVYPPGSFEVTPDGRLFVDGVEVMPSVDSGSAQADDPLEAYTPSYAVMDEWAVLGSTLESLELFHDALTGGTDSLDDNAEFRRVMDAAPSPAHYFFYVNVAALVEAIDDALTGEDRRTFRNDVRPYIENLGAFLVTSSVTPREVRVSAILTAVE